MNFFQGVVEEHDKDPLKMGRIKVRVFGIHTEFRDSEVDFKQLTVDDLPWAHPCFPINSSNIDGICDFQVPRKGSHVLVCFLDDEYQRPVYIGTLSKIPEKQPDYSKGFSDPDKIRPITEKLNESPISRLARNEKISETIIQEKKDSVKKAIECYQTNWDEPPTTYNAEYTKNRVIETESGHYVELDDTDGTERIHIYHRKDTSVEMFPDGDRVDRINKSKYTIILTDDNILIEGNQNVHINIDRNQTIDHDQNTHIKNDKNCDIDNDQNKDVSRNVNINIGNTKTETAGTDIIETAGNNILITAGSLVAIKAPLITLN